MYACRRAQCGLNPPPPLFHNMGCLHSAPKEKDRLAKLSGLEVKQVSNWFINARKRLWQPALLERGEDIRSHLSNGKGRLIHQEQGQPAGPCSDSEHDDDDQSTSHGQDKKVYI